SDQAFPLPEESSFQLPTLDEVFGTQGDGDSVGELGGGSPSFKGGNGTNANDSPTDPPSLSPAEKRRLRETYLRSLEGLLAGRVRYPLFLARAGIEGRVELCIQVALDGRIESVRVCLSSGFDEFDEAALAAARTLERVPPPPSEVWSTKDEIHAGVVFALER
ncbi:MAG: TonB family protein, partial [Deltaproteobacteria bacterium]|nr:TonB family protein [Deltaproteobacteria bacterium]